jgi:hypothetical protein
MSKIHQFKLITKSKIYKTTKILQLELNFLTRLFLFRGLCIGATSKTI